MTSTLGLADMNLQRYQESDQAGQRLTDSRVKSVVRQMDNFRRLVRPGGLFRFLVGFRFRISQELLYFL